MSTFEHMVATLHKSVSDIVQAAPTNRDELVATSFAEFEAAVAPELNKAVEEGTEGVLAKLAAETPELFQEPLFKGLGTVGRLANLLSSVARMAKDIQDGTGYDNDNDPASDEVSSLLDHVVAICELALRAAVNDHVEIADPDDAVDDDMSYVQVPNAEDNSDDAALVVKSALPMDLAKYACDPAAIAMRVIDLGSGLLLDAGVPQESLSKLFDGFGGNTLAKDAGMADPNAAAPDAGGDAGGDPGADPNDIGAQLEIAGRIAAAMLMQVDHCMQLIDGGQGGGSMDGPDDGTDAGDGTDPADPNGDGTGPTDGAPDDGTAPADGSTPPADGSTPPANDGKAPAPADDGTDPKKKPFGKAADGVEDPAVVEMRKAMSDMQKQMLKLATAPNAELADLKKQMAKLSAQPAPAKGVIHQATLGKAADTRGGAETELEKMARDIDGCRTDEQRTQMLLKAAIKFPGVDLSALSKAR